MLLRMALFFLNYPVRISQKSCRATEMLAIYVCRGSISRIEDKQRTVTDIELYGLSQVFQVPVSYFFPE